MNMILVVGPFPIPKGPHPHSQPPPLPQHLKKQGCGSQLLAQSQQMDQGDLRIRLPGASPLAPSLPSYQGCVH